MFGMHEGIVHNLCDGPECIGRYVLERPPEENGSEERFYFASTAGTSHPTAMLLSIKFVREL